MAILNYPGVTTTEIDNSRVIARPATSVPAGVIGTAGKGPAYVPLTFSTYSGFSNVFGVAGARFGPIAVSLWLNGGTNKNATYLRVLGAGNGNKRAGDGSVTYAGFTVGEQLPGTAGITAANPYANAGGNLGRTYFLGCFMSESAGSTIFSSANVQTTTGSVPIIRGVIMTPSGVSLALSSSNNGTVAPATLAHSASPVTGTYDFTNNYFVLMLNGHKGTIDNPNVITASFSSIDSSGNAFSTKLNKDPTKIQEKGHYLYTWYDVPDQLAVLTGSGVISRYAVANDVVFITSSSLGRDTGNTTTPNFEQFKDRYGHSKSPYVVSQDYGGIKYDLFRVHTISDGLQGNKDRPTPDINYKITISNIIPATTVNPYGQFDLEIRTFSLQDGASNPLQSSAGSVYFSGLTFDPNSENYIAAQVGDQNIYFDFDRNNGSQKIAVQGDYPINNDFIRIELSPDFLAGNIPTDAIPAGYRGYAYIYTSGSQLSTYAASNTDIFSDKSSVIETAVIPPVPVRLSLQETAGASTRDSVFTWGTKFEKDDSTTDLNKSQVFNDSLLNFVKYFPNYDTANKKFFIQDTAANDTFNNNYFTIENIRVTTGAFGVAADIDWDAARYVRQGSITTDDSAKTRALQIADLNRDANRKYVSFTFFLQGGFDGVNIFDTQKSNLTDLAATREINDSTQGGANGPTVSAYKKAIDIMGSTADVNMQLLAIPGLRTPTVTNYAITAVENRFDALYLMDIQQKNDNNEYITGSDSPNVTNTVTDFLARGLNTSFAAAYFPDLNVLSPDPGVGEVTVPPSAAVLAAYAVNDTYAPWYAPAGKTRGVIPASAGGLKVPLSEGSSTLGTIYEADINPIVRLSTSGSPTVVWGQKTLLRAASSLDRVNVRRLLIDVRRRVRAVANSLLFEPNTQATLARFNSLVAPIMQDVQSRFGVERYRVLIDASTTTQADIDNNTIRGKIFLQPTRVAEFIQLDFVINASSAT